MSLFQNSMSKSAPACTNQIVTLKMEAASFYKTRDQTRYAVQHKIMCLCAISVSVWQLLSCVLHCIVI
jgi:hypothetical protein